MEAVMRSLKLGLALLLSAHLWAGTAPWNQLPVRTSPSLSVIVHRDRIPVGAARVDIYRVMENGESHVWTGVTGVDGIVSPPTLPVGKYRVFADTGMSEAAVYLDVEEKYKWDRAGIELPPPNEVIVALMSTPVSTSVREFRGVVQLDNGVFLSGVQIRIFRKASLERGYVGQFRSDEKGQFVIPLGSGNYIAVFQWHGLKTRAVGFEVAEKGLDRPLQLRMEIDRMPKTSGDPVIRKILKP